MTKKAAALLLAASLAVSVCATPVFATGTHGTEVSGNASTPNTKSETTVEYKVTEGYTWAIPATIDFGSNAGVKKSVRLSPTRKKIVATIALLMRIKTVRLAMFTFLIAGLSRAQS